MRPSHLLALAFGVIALSTAPVVLAQPTSGSSPSTESMTQDEMKKEAILRFKRGLEFYGDGAFAAALIEFRRANELAPNWRIQYNIAQVCAQVQEYVCAIDSFTAYLKEGGSEVPEERRTEVNNELARLRARVATLVIRTDVEGVEVSIDEVPVGTTPLDRGVTVSSGRHRIGLTKPGFLPVTRQVDVAGQESRDVDVTLVPQVVNAEPSSPAPAQHGPSSGMTTASWVGVGIAGALAVTAGITGGAALSASSDLQDTRYARPDDAQSAQTRVKTLALVTDVAAGAAVLTLGTVLAVTFWPHRGEAKGRVGLGLGPTGARLEGSF